jgi:chorismate mutase/prephenate dehydratase
MEHPTGGGESPSQDGTERRPEEAKPAAIEKLRERINQIDAGIVSLLAERRQLSIDVIRTKDVDRSPIRDQGREEQILLRLIQLGRELGLDAHFVTRVFQEIIDNSIRLQQEYLLKLASQSGGEPEIIRVAFQGIEGAYSHLAAKKYFAAAGERLRFLGLPTFREVIRAVEDGLADYAMLPVENTTSGPINDVNDLLLNTKLFIVGEEKFRVTHCLVSTADVPLTALRRVLSHPQAVAQCSEFLATLPDCKVEYFTDTAMSVSRIKEEGDPSQAAIASEEAARMFGLKVLCRDIANQKENFTRFLIGAPKPRAVDARIPSKTSIVLATADVPGALAESLLVFDRNGINMTMIHSRPILGNPWEYMFYIDIEGNIADERVKTALDELSRSSRFLKVLGSYPSQDLPPTVPKPQALGGAKPAGAAAAARGEPSPRAQRGEKRSASFEVKGVRIGAGAFVLIAGPSAVESYEQILECARQVKEHGGQVLRGNCFKTRSSPDGFQGLGAQGLDYLCEAGRAHGLPVLTEVAHPEDVDKAARKADLLLIGARNLQNYPLLGEVGRVHRPVVLKRGPMATIEEWLRAAEFILAQGNQQVILCERGIRTFETAYRNSLDLNAVPVLKRLTHLPVIVDPSNAAGDRELVPPLAIAARAIGAHGVMVEIHPDPDRALCDGPQALGFADFAALAAQLVG